MTCKKEYFSLSPWRADSVLEERVKQWANRRDFSIVWSFYDVLITGEHALQVSIDMNECDLLKYDRSIRRLRNIIHRWKKEQAKHRAELNVARAKQAYEERCAQRSQSKVSNGRLASFGSMIRDASTRMNQYRCEINELPVDGSNYDHLGILWRNASTLLKEADALEKAISRQLDKASVDRALSLANKI